MTSALPPLATALKKIEPSESLPAVARLTMYSQ
jgi:hypothetical protein